jgi:hypothetical protein
MIQLRDIDVVGSVARYYTLTRAQINRLHFPNDHDGRITRRRLNFLSGEGLINRTHMQVSNPANGAPAYVYYPSAKGCAFLAQELKDESFKNVCTLTPNWQYLHHWVAVADTHILIDQAVKRTRGVAIDGWFSEWDVVNADEKEPDKRFRLYVRLGQKLVCIPDAAFLLNNQVKVGENQFRSYRKVFYIEQDRHTTESADRVAAQKFNGYAALFEKRLHVGVHFPLANVEKFSVLVIAPTPNRRDALKLAFKKKADKSAWLYLFASLPDLQPETVLTAPVWHSCDGNAYPLTVEGGAE